MFTNFRLENFKSYRESTLHLAPLTLMIGDWSIIAVWEQQCELNPSRRVAIWTYDDPLQNRSKRLRHNRSGSRVLFAEIVHPV